MKRKFLLAGAFLANIAAWATPEYVPVSTFNTSLILQLDSAAAPALVYYGPAVKGDLAQIAASAPEDGKSDA